jgi:SAM-dependent methyltransferase
MRQIVKRLLRTVGLYERASCWYHLTKQYRPGYIGRQVRYRLFGAEDGYRVPPTLYVHRIIARGWGAQYMDMGAEAMDQIEAVLQRHGVDLADCRDILDFGCGCGRLIRQLPKRTAAKLHGTDYNAPMIRWCKRNLPFATFSRNGLEPPLDFPDAGFDLVYMISVFTHLSADLQRRWAREIHRILRPGGHFYFTTHGDTYFEFLTPEQIERFKAGEVVVIDRDAEGTNHYGSFESATFVKNELLRGFELVGNVPGPGNLTQEIFIARKPVE